MLSVSVTLDARSAHVGIAAEIKRVVKDHPGNQEMRIRALTSSGMETLLIGARVDAFDPDFRAEMGALGFEIELSE